MLTIQVKLEIWYFFFFVEISFSYTLRRLHYNISLFLCKSETYYELFHLMNDLTFISLTY